MTKASYWASVWNAAWFLGLTELAGTPVDDRHSLAGIVDKQTLAEVMLLTHHHIHLAGPDSVMLAEPAVLEALRLAQPIRLPEPRQDHAGAA